MRDEKGSFFAALYIHVFCCLCTVVGVAADTLYTTCFNER